MTRQVGDRRRDAGWAAIVVLGLVGALLAAGFVFGPALMQSGEADAGAAASDAPTAPPIDDDKLAAVRKRLEREVRQAIAIGTKASLRVVDVATRKTVWQHQPGLALVPASNTKLYCGAAILEAAGPDWEFETAFHGTRALEADGTLRGDLVVVGSGDPTLSFRFVEGEALTSLEGIAALLKKAGVRRIEGDLVGDGSRFVGPRKAKRWPKDPYWRWWMVEVNALVFNDNRVLIGCSGDGERAKVTFDPDVGYVTLDNRLGKTDKANRQNIVVTRPDDSNRFTVSGDVWKGTSDWTTPANIHDGDRYFVTALRAALRRGGIEVTGGARVADGAVDTRGMPTLFTYRSKLRDSLPKMLKVSQNLYAEIYLRTLALLNGRPASFDGGTGAMLAWLDEIGVRGKSMAFADGSGLSRANFISAEQTTDLLVYMARRSPHAKLYRSFLAEPGRPGTLRKRMKELHGSLHAKTGTLSNVSALSGYITTRSGREIAFSALFNKCSVASARGLQDRLCRIVHAEL